MTSNTFQEVAEHLSLEYDHNDTSLNQDWDLTVADPARIPEFLDGFAGLTAGARVVLAEIVMASFDEAEEKGELVEDDWNRFLDYLLRDSSAYSEFFEYWLDCTQHESWALGHRLRKTLGRDR